MLEGSDVVMYVLFVGEMLIDLVPEPSGLNDIRGYLAHPGGSVANVAVALARLGGASRFVGKLSADDFGQMLLNVLGENEVDIRYVSTTAQANTTLVLLTSAIDGQRTFTFYRHRTADTLLEITDLSPQIWEKVAIIHTSSLLLASEPARSAMWAALDQAYLRGLLVSFDLNVRPAAWQTEAEVRETMSQVLARVDLLKCSAEEIHYLHPSWHTPLSSTDLPRLRECGYKLLEQRPSLVIITLGERGALLMTSQHTTEVPTRACETLDTRGAADAFMAALLRQLLEYQWITGTQLAALSKEQLQELGAFANKVAAISCTRYGGIQSFPYLEEVERS